MANTTIPNAEHQSLQLGAIPDELKARDQWVLWALKNRGGKETKVPMQLNGQCAKANDKSTWGSFASVEGGLKQTKFAGIGYVFCESDPYCGIDLDGCYNSKSNTIDCWAIEILQKFRSYAEISPSGTGVKIFCRGKSPMPTGKKIAVNVAPINAKQPAIEVYDKLRYFAVTGLVLPGHEKLNDGTEALAWLVEKYFATPSTNGHAANGHSPKAYTNGAHASDAAVADRARKYVAKMPAAISGQSGHNQTFHVACVLVLGFGLPEDVALDILREFNARCLPKWSDKELAHKIASAAKQPGERGYLLHAREEQWARIADSTYTEQAAPQEGSKALKPIPASKLNAGDSAVWLWFGYIAANSITLFSALWKSGKTTLLAHLLRAFASNGMFCDRAITQAKVLYLTEESEPRWARRCEELFIGDHVEFLIRPFKIKPKREEWEMFLAQLSTLVQVNGYSLIVFDTLASLWPVRDENDAGQVMEALMPLQTLSEKAAIVLVHHLRKGDGQEATAARGSGALPALVDTIVELRRFDAADKQSTKRTLLGYGRCDETPPELVIELDQEHQVYAACGDRHQVAVQSAEATIIAILPKQPPGFGYDDIKKHWPESQFPRKKTILEALTNISADNTAIREGTGKKSQKYTYWVQDSVSVPEAKTASGTETE